MRGHRGIPLVGRSATSQSASPPARRICPAHARGRTARPRCGLTSPHIPRATHQGCLIHPKEFEKHAPVREPSTPRTIVPKEEGVPDDSLPREDRTTWFVASSRQRAARRAAVSAHMALDGGVDCRCRGDLRPYWGAAHPSGPLGRKQDEIDRLKKAAQP